MRSLAPFAGESLSDDEIAVFRMACREAEWKKRAQKKGKTSGQGRWRLTFDEGRQRRNPPRKGWKCRE